MISCVASSDNPRSFEPLLMKINARRLPRSSPSSLAAGSRGHGQALVPVCNLPRGFLGRSVQAGVPERRSWPVLLQQRGGRQGHTCGPYFCTIFPEIGGEPGRALPGGSAQWRASRPRGDFPWPPASSQFPRPCTGNAGVAGRPRPPLCCLRTPSSLRAPPQGQRGLRITRAPTRTPGVSLHPVPRHTGTWVRLPAWLLPHPFREQQGGQAEWWVRGLPPSLVPSLAGDSRCQLRSDRREWPCGSLIRCRTPSYSEFQMSSVISQDSKSCTEATPCGSCPRVSERGTGSGAG